MKIFPLLKNKMNDIPLVYLDNAATTQKPRSVIDAINNFYLKENCNVHRGIYTLSQQTSEKFENTRKKIAKFINTDSDSNIVFTKGTTESINMVAQSFVKPKLKTGDEILITEMEHHSNIVPWQLIAEQTGAVIKAVPVTSQGELNMNAYEKLLSSKTKIVAAVHVSNTLGTVNPIEKIIKLAHKHNIPVLVDGAQAIAHQPINVQKINCDFYVFSAHKMYGPTGVGVLYGKKPHLNTMLPYQGGGDMIVNVTMQKTTFKPAPHKFEAGTPNIAGVIGLGAAVDFIKTIGYKKIQSRENKISIYAEKKISQIPGLKIIGQAQKKSSIISFVIDGIHPHDIGTVLDQHGIAIRTGHHCTQPLMEKLKLPATARVSLAYYNNKKDIDRLFKALQATIELLK